MDTFSLLIKPAGPDCNLRCAYCFYRGRAALFPGSAQHRLSPAILERLVASYLATEQPVYSFGWQGGEPTLMGVEFLRRVTTLQQRHGRPGAMVANGLQTNATLVDEELARHLARYNFLVGVSLDGPAALHDRYRRDAAGGGSHEQVLRGLRTLQRCEVACNALTLVSAANVGHAGQVYRYLQEQGLEHHQYLPCVEFDAAGRPLPYTLTGAQWGDFLCALFDEWWPHDTRRVSVRRFDALVGRLVDGRRLMCTMGESCSDYLLVEHTGDVYPCDFFVEPDRRLGNLMQQDWAELRRVEAYRRFGAQKAQWSETCAACEFLPLCAGDCLKHRFRTGADPRALSWLCEGWRQFFRHALPRLQALAAEVRREQAASEVAPPSRNDPCPCGSGRKYKQCCARLPRGSC